MTFVGDRRVTFVGGMTFVGEVIFVGASCPLLFFLFLAHVTVESPPAIKQGKFVSVIVTMWASNRCRCPCSNSTIIIISSKFEDIIIIIIKPLKTDVTPTGLIYQ